jgi:hypothetical protein
MAANEAEIDAVLAAALKQPVKATLIGWADTMDAAVMLARTPIAERQARPVTKSTNTAKTARDIPVPENLTQPDPGAIEPGFAHIGAPVDEPAAAPVPTHPGTDAGRAPRGPCRCTTRDHRWDRMGSRRCDRPEGAPRALSDL